MKLGELENLFIDLYDVKDQLKQLVYNRSMEAFDTGDRVRDQIQSKQDVEVHREWTRQKLIQSLGGLPSSDTPLQPKVTGVLPCIGYTIEKIIFQSRPDTYVTSNLYVPDGIDSPRGAVLFLCGHHDTAKHNSEYQTVCQYLVRAGLVVFAIDPVGQGERYSYYEPSLGKSTVDCGVLEHDYAGTQSWFLGDSLARYLVHDAMRAVDYLCTRPEVDPARIGVTGNSGGGTQTSLMMICDRRIAAAAPATFIMNRRSYLWSGQPQDAEQIWPGMTAIGIDHEDILLVMVPRPVLVLAAVYDFFPIEGTRRTVQRTQRFWDIFGRSDCLEFFEEPEIHKYSVAMAKKAAEFFAKHLFTESVKAAGRQSAGDSNEVTNEQEFDLGIRPLAHSMLWCTLRGQVRDEFEYVRAVHEENLDRLNALEAGRSGLQEQEYKKQALTWLSGKVFASRKLCDLNPRLVPHGQLDELIVQSVVWWSQEGILNHGLMFRHFLDKDIKLPLTIAIWDYGTHRIQPHISWLRSTCSKGKAVMILDVTGVGALSPNALNSHDIRDTFGTLYKLTTDLFWLDDSLAAIRTFDVLRALDLAGILPNIDCSDLSLYTNGRYSLYAQLASALDTRIKHMEVADGITRIAPLVSMRYFDKFDVAGLILPGMLKFFDLPDLERWSSFNGFISSMP